MEGMIFQTSLIAAFIAGMVALFAPCCITFLLPAYLGSVFKEKERVLFMTLIFGLGIFVVLMPAVLGVAFISQALFRYHDTIYFAGGLVMLLVAIVAFLGIKLPMPRLPQTEITSKTDVLSIFVLGIFSGITSACCAPVLIGILAMTFLSPSFFGALFIGAMYVLGMVTPLLLISLFLSGKVPNLNVLRKPVTQIKILGHGYPIILSNLIAALIFFFTGILTLFLTATGRISGAGMDEFTKTIQNAGGFVNSLVGGNIVLNIIFVALIFIVLYLIAKKA